MNAEHLSKIAIGKQLLVDLKADEATIQRRVQEAEARLRQLQVVCDHTMPDGKSAWKDSGGGSCGFMYCTICEITDL